MTFAVHQQREQSNGTEPAAIEAMFDRIANRYDLFNMLASASLDERWRRQLAARVRRGARVLDIGCGTGASARRLAQRVGPSGRVVGVDVSERMLEIARQRRPLRVGTVRFIRANALTLPFPDEAFDYVTSAFVTRNVMMQLDELLAELRRVLVPGGALCFLDMTRPPRNRWLRGGYSWYVTRVIPGIGRTLYGDRQPFDYLARSIVGCLDPEGLRARIAGAGFSQARFEPLTGGLVGIHMAVK
jgi:demethylmenaquinone methyltransferase/2-methoxy-6-polyprenyl-1,4-benzoquinol methylase